MEHENKYLLRNKLFQYLNDKYADYAACNDNNCIILLVIINKNVAIYKEWNFSLP